MMNLLPTEQVVVIKVEYRKRRRAVAGVLVLAWLVVLILVTFSFYIFARSERLAAISQLTTKQEMLAKTETGGSGDELTRLANDIRTITAAERERVLPFGFFQKILAAKPAGIKIKGLLFAKGGATTPVETTIDLTGVASSRRLLLTFIERLKEDKTFIAVDSPVSNLIKESNVDFTLKLHLGSIPRHE